MLDDETIKRARAIFERAWQNATGTKPKRGITTADVLRVFPGGRVLTEEEARALKEGTAAEERPQQQQLRLVPGGKK